MTYRLSRATPTNATQTAAAPARKNPTAHGSATAADTDAPHPIGMSNIKAIDATIRTLRMVRP